MRVRETNCFEVTFDITEYPVHRHLMFPADDGESAVAQTKMLCKHEGLTGFRLVEVRKLNWPLVIIDEGGECDV